ncbi:RNA polymerase, sigma-24 subunit, ECF subfamily [Allomuricauda ruestringensis DSM 13258]|uniref:RNA polymerase, sigma-24 subunit, ECF subfamily n=1 Tax=Allomuricauda ruestringensis (strain DSM 13258 / CIP 107369 / LMG 19739 / B1) TaxID=886377 RepID=G2PID7_ALLRU|nr:RNA polymerase sigma-70 factor [Allomuricauda ruestringensis]AEM71755.1 RNA polymerase, sigma-24 subunit, ECF subfamily [Allomuricauda ruestringensis DSM 13258]
MRFKVEELFKNNYPLLCLVSFSIVKDKDIAKDIVQDFFVSFWNKRESIIIQISFEAYAKKSVKNLSLQYLEKKKREQKLLDTFETDTGVPETKSDKQNNKLNELINKLPKKRKEIFVSVVVDGKSYTEIAEANGISVNTVKTQMKRAYAFLRSYKKEDYISVILLIQLSRIVEQLPSFY